MTVSGSEPEPNGQRTCIALIGMPGSGKSTVGRQLARKLNYSFIDVDTHIEMAQSCPVREIFERIGEEGFRQLESAAISDLTTARHCVISTGGGSIIDPRNRTHLKSRCVCIYLHSTPEDLFRRLYKDQKRPLLQVSDPLDRLRQLYRARDPLYQEIATLRIETGKPAVRFLVNLISQRLIGLGFKIQLIVDSHK